MTYGEYRRVEHRGVDDHDMMMVDPPQVERYDPRFNPIRQYDGPGRPVPMQQMPVTYAQQDREMGYPTYTTAPGSQSGYRPQQFSELQEYQPYPIDQAPQRPQQVQSTMYRPDDMYVQQVRPGQNVMPPAPFQGPRSNDQPRQAYQPYPQEPARRR